jgi:hypothetical protein
VDWDAIGAVGEILGATAVFASLFYLALQIRSQTRQAKAAMVQTISAELAKGTDASSQNPEFATIMLKAIKGEELSQLERFRINQYLNRCLNTWLAVQHAYDRGQIDRDYFESICHDVNRLVGVPAFARELNRLLESFPIERQREMFKNLPTSK